MSVQRINEISVLTGAIVGKTIEAKMGTSEERTFMREAMARGINVVERLQKMVAEGLTFDAWREYYLDVNCSEDFMALFAVNDREEMEALRGELKDLDLREYYETIVLPFANPAQLEQDVIAMRANAEVMEEIWTEEDSEKGVHIKVVDDSTESVDTTPNPETLVLG